MVVGFIVVTFFRPDLCRAKGGPFGLGAIFGYPTAITGKWFTDSSTAMDLGLWFSSGSVGIYGDYLWHKQNLLNFGSARANSEIFYYLGVGPGVYSASDREYRFYARSDSRTAVWVRVPVGVDWRPSTVTLSVFLELVPGISILPDVGFSGNAGLGIRYFF